MRNRDAVLYAPEGWTAPPERLQLQAVPRCARAIGRATNVRLIVEVALSRHASSISVQEREAIANAAAETALDLFTTGAKS